MQQKHCRAWTRLSCLRILPLAASLIFAGCTVKPKPIDEEARQQFATEAKRKLFADQEDIKGPLSLYDATARAIKYNVEYRVRLMDQAAAAGQLEVAQYDLLPRLTASAGYTDRNNESFGFGVQPNGQIGASPSASQERQHSTHSIGLVWNVLDFGVSYVRAQQSADQGLIAEERRRKALQNLIQDVRLAWWRAEAAQRLLPQIDVFLEEVDQAQARARLIENRKLLPPLQTVSYRRSLLDLEQQISLRRQELAQARVEFASIINLPPGANFQVQSPEPVSGDLPDLTADVSALEMLALNNRPELREEAYKSRVSELEARKALLQLLPSVGFDVTRNYDGNRFLVNNLWTSAGMNVAFNLMKVFSLPAMGRSKEAQKQADETRRLAVAMSVLTQTRLAAVRYGMLAHEYGVWDEAVQDDDRIVKYLSSAKDVGLETELELVRARGRALISKVQRHLVYANLESVIGRLYNSVGLDSLPAEMTSHDPAALAKELQAKIAGWQTASFAAVAKPMLGSVVILPVAGIPGEAGEPFRTALQRVLRLARIPVVAESDARFTLETSVILDAPKDTGRPAKMSVKIFEGDRGRPVFESEQRSMMSEPISLDQWRAIAEGAGYAISEPLRRLSAKPAAKSGDAGPEMPRMMIGRRIGSSTIDSGPELEVADDGYFLRLERRLNLPGPTAVAEKSGTINANP